LDRKASLVVSAAVVAAGVAGTGLYLNSPGLQAETPATQAGGILETSDAAEAQATQGVKVSKTENPFESWGRVNKAGLKKAPEFEFEKNPDNVRAAVDKFGIRFPVRQDNNYETWRAYENRYWPRSYIVDAEGCIRYSHIGEGNYSGTEAMIGELLKEV
jgi:hypothetical protein